MRRLCSLLIAAAAVALAPALALAQSATTTRIETRPFYGATVTLEEGVRVFRPLPPHERIIINPQGATPLNLTYEQRRSVSHNYHYGSDRQDDGGIFYGGTVGEASGRPKPRRHGDGYVARSAEGRPAPAKPATRH